MRRSTYLVSSVLVLIALCVGLSRGDPLPKVLSPVSRITGGWQIAWTGETNRTYRLERTSEFRSPTLWEPVATVTATNGVISADDLVGPEVSARFYRVVLLTNLPTAEIFIGSTSIRSHSFVTNGPHILLDGPAGIGLLTVNSTAPLLLEVATARLTGIGVIALPASGLVLNGAFAARLDKGKLTFAAPIPPFTLGDFIRIRPTALTIDVETGAISGAGAVDVLLANDAPLGRAAKPAAEPVQATLEGSFELNSLNRRLAFTGTATYRDVVATGSGEIDTATATFSLTGSIAISGGDQAQFTLLEATFALLRPNNATPEFAISGRPNLPALQGLNLQVTGSLRLNGEINLSGTGSGNLSALQFSNLQAEYSRPAGPGGAATLRFNGGLALPNVLVSELKGSIKADGSLEGVQTMVPLTLKPGLEIRPRTENGSLVPVLKLLQSVGGRHTFQVRGEFLTPEENGVKPVSVDGSLVLRTVGATLDVESFQVSNPLPILDWPLPSQIRLADLTVVISYRQPDFEARMRGSVILAYSQARPVTLGLDAALIFNINDPLDVGFDTAIRVQKLDLHQKVYISDAQFRLIVGTRPPSATLALINGSAGFFPKFPATNPPALYQRSDFNLFAASVSASIGFSPQGLSLALTNGFLQLPLLFTNQPAGLCPNNSSGTSIGLGPRSAITIDVFGRTPEDLTVRAIGSLNFTNIAVLPQLHGVAAELCRASLIFNPGGIPYLSNLVGAVVFPFPSGQTNRVELIDGAWGLHGFPTGTVALASDLKLYEGHGIKVTLLGRGKGRSPCSDGVALTARPDPAGGSVPVLVLDGASEFILPADLVTEVDGDTAKFVNCASITLPPGPPFYPKLDIKTLQFGGTFHLGGASGFVLSNSVVTVNNLDNLFSPSPAEPFVVALSGTLVIPNGPALSLDDAKLTLSSPTGPPRFTIRGAGYSESEFALAQKIPVRVTSASFTFKDPNKPLSELLKPANVNLKFSVLAAIPSTQKKIFEGSIQDLKVTVGVDGTPILEDVDGFSMLIRGLNLPPLSEIGGGVIASGLSRAAGVGGNRGAAPAGLLGGDFSDLFFAGTVEGSYQGYKLKLLLAFRTSGMVGVCLDVNAGNVGIPLDGGVLGGILLTGASGGMAFGQGFVDPCEFTSYIGPDGKPKPGVTELPKISWDDLLEKIKRAKEFIDKFGSSGGIGGASSERNAGLAGAPKPAGLSHARSTNEFGLPCPGDCPPPTINIFCQPHPDHDRFPHRVITRFSSVDEGTLNQLGFTRQWVADKYHQGGNWAVAIAQGVAAGLRQYAFSITPLPDPQFLGAQAAVIRGIIDEGLAELERTYIPLIRDIIAQEISPDLIYNKIRDTAYGGVPCADLTLALNGTLTHSAVSSFLSGTVGAAVSTAGVGGIAGRVNVLGVPVGRAKGFIAGTDEKGEPNPALCAEVIVEAGPLSLGEMRGSYALQGGVSGFSHAFERIVQCLSDLLFFDILRQVAPQIVTVGKTRIEISREMNAGERAAMIATLYSRPDLPAELRNCYAQGIQTIIAEVNPEILFCGEVRPRLFGFPLGSELVSAGMQITKTNYVAVSSGSPSAMVAAALALSGAAGGGAGVVVAAPAIAASLFVQERGTVGAALTVPDPAQAVLAGIEGRFSSPQAFGDWINREFDSFLENATYTLGFTVSPLGMRMVDTQARVLIPNLRRHPARPGSTWVRPENRSQPANLPSRLDLILSALTNHLSGSSLGLISDPQWRGTATDLQLAVPTGAGHAALANLSFVEDYFPHGGVIGGGFIQIPRALYEAPPAELATALDANKDALTRLSAAAVYLTDYVLQSRRAGSLAFYVPAPNPPVFVDTQGAALPPRLLLESIRNRPIELLPNLAAYPSAEFFLKGYVEGQLLDVPIGRASLEGRLEDPSVGTSAHFLAKANVPSGSWLDKFSPGASLEFELHGTPPQTVESVFSNRLAAVQSVLAGPRPPALLQSALAGLLDDLQSKLPKVKLEAVLPLQMPSPLADIVQFQNTRRFYCYSPRFDPAYAPGDTRPVARVRRDGGLAMQGDLVFKANGASVATVADGQLQVTVRPNKLPILSGDFNVPNVTVGSLSLKNGHLDFVGDDLPKFSIQGFVDPLPIGSAFRIEPLNGAEIGGRLEVARTGPGTAATQFFLRPAQLVFGGTRYLVHGGKRTNDFGFSSTGAWSATLEVTNDLILKAGNVVVARVSRGTLVDPVHISGNGRTSMEVSANLGVNTTVSVFPDLPFGRTLFVKSNPSGQVVIRSDGTFEITGALELPLSLPSTSFAVSQFNAGGTFRIANDGLTLTGQVAGGALAQVGGPAFSTSATIKLSPDGSLQFQTSNTVEFPPLQFGSIRVQGANGGNLVAKLLSGGLELSGAHLAYENLFSNSLPTFTLPRSGDFALDFGPATFALGKIPLQSVRYRLVRNNGVISLLNFQASFPFPGLNSSLSLAGTVDGGGAISLSATSSAGNLANFPVGNVSGTLERNAGDYGQIVAAANPLAFWQLDEKSGTLAASTASSKADGIYQPGVVLGQPGATSKSTSVRFDGKSGYVAVKDSTVFDAIDRALTLEAWIRVNAFDRTWNTIISKGDSAWRLQRNGDLKSLAFDTDGLSPPYLGGNRPVDDGAWHHIVATYDGVAKYLWIDGELDAWTRATGNIQKNAFQVSLGENTQATKRYWNGWLDDVAVYTRALRPSEILDHYRAGGGLILRGQLRVGINGVNAAVLNGAFSAGGAMALEASGVATAVGGFPLSDASIRFTRGPGGNPALFVDANLSPAGIPPLRVQGDVSASGGISFVATPGNSSLFGFEFSNVNLALNGNVNSASIAWSGILSIKGLANLPFSGNVSPAGEFDLSNTLLNSGNFFGYPVGNWSFTLRRRPADYRSLVAGDPLVAQDRGSDPVAYWRLGETVGPKLADSKKTGAGRPSIAGTYLGKVDLGRPGAVSGGNTAAGFDGQTAYVSINDESAFDFTKAVSVEAWIRVPAWTRTWQSVVAKGDSSWRLTRYADTGRISFETTSAAGHHSLPGERQLADNQWHHVVGVYDGFAKFLFVDGSLEAFSPYTETLRQNDQPVLLGENSEAAGRFFNGQLDEVAIYGRPLSASEVNAHFVAGGGTALAAQIKLGLPGLSQSSLFGTLNPSGSFCLQADVNPFGIVGFNLNAARVTLARTANGGAQGVLGGSVNSILGTLDVAGSLSSDGNYLLQTAANGSLNIAGRTLVYSSPAKLTRTQLEASGNLNFGKFNFNGVLKLPVSGAPNFSGATSGETAFLPFGTTPDGKPGHPYAKLVWNATAAYNSGTQKIEAGISGNIVIEYEKFPKQYVQQSIGFGPLNLPDTGQISVTPGTFQGISVFGFNLP